MVQGEKSFFEVLHSTYQLDIITGTESFFSNFPEIHSARCRKFITSESELESMGSFSSNNSVIAVVKIPEPKLLEIGPKEKVLILDDIRDPGNFGTLIRTADWFGIRKIVVSLNSVDIYNPKVINSSMGSFVRVDIFYEDLQNFFTGSELNVYLADMEGENFRNLSPSEGGCLVLGNESNGPSGFWQEIPHKQISIPGGQKTESLNVSIAGGILINWFVS